MDCDGNFTERVRAAWMETLPSVAFDPDRSWRELGLNSLKALELALRVERALGIKVTFDGLTPDCTTNDWIRLLTERLGSDAPGRDPRPRVFFVTGLEGDNPNQAIFRHALRREVRFETLDAGGIDMAGRMLVDVAVRAGMLVEQIVARQPEGDVRLVGCSFGALLAQEMARQLEARGRTVAFLALLDGFLAPPLWEPLKGSKPERTIARIQARERWKRRLMRWTGPVLRHSGAFELVRRIVASPRFRDRRWARAAALRVLRASGYWALGSWRAGPCRAHALLIATDDFPKFSSFDQWRALCPRLDVVTVPGRHFQLFFPAAMTLLVPAFLGALAKSKATGASPLPGGRTVAA